MQLINCPICGKKIKDETYEHCLNCGWEYWGGEQFYAEDEKDDCNAISREEAKENYKKGLDVWGNPKAVWLDKLKKE